MENCMDCGEVAHLINGACKACNDKHKPINWPDPVQYSDLFQQDFYSVGEIPVFFKAQAC